MDIGGLRQAKLAFLGAGNMAEALLHGVLAGGLLPAARVTASDPSAERRALMQQRFGVNVTDDNATAVADADVVVLAVKPQVAAGVLDGLKAEAPGDALWISICAGLTTAGIEGRLPAMSRVVRAMPNTPALVGLGAAAICAGTRADADDLALAELLLGSVGCVVRVEETQMDAVTALSGSGPAYVFYLLEGMLAAAREMDLPDDAARSLALATVEGAARLALETGEKPATLRARVTSRGGTTQAATDCLDRLHVMDAVREALVAARDRSLELSREA